MKPLIQVNVEADGRWRFARGGIESPMRTEAPPGG